MFGCIVHPLSQPGVPDLLVKLPNGRVEVLECKAPEGRRTPAQVAFQSTWGPVPVVRSIGPA